MTEPKKREKRNAVPKDRYSGRCDYCQMPQTEAELVDMAVGSKVYGLKRKHGGWLRAAPKGKICRRCRYQGRLTDPIFNQDSYMG